MSELQEGSEAIDSALQAAIQAVRRVKEVAMDEGRYGLAGEARDHEKGLLSLSAGYVALELAQEPHAYDEA